MPFVDHLFKNNSFTILKVGIIGIGLLLMLSSCNTTKYLGPNEILLKKNKLEFKDDTYLRKKNNLKYDIFEIIAAKNQEPNSKFLGLFRTNLWFYYKTTQPDDTSKFKNWVRRSFAEPPTLYSKTGSDQTSKSIKNYLLNKGYLDVQVDHRADVRNNKAVVTYQVKPEQPYVIDRITFFAENERIQKILNELAPESHFEKGAPLDANLYDQERTRITEALRNRGYAYFNRNYISNLIADTSDHKVDARLEIVPPGQDSTHQAYYVGDIYFYPNYQPAQSTANLRDSVIDNYHFLLNERGLNIDPNTLINETFLLPGDLYSQEEFDQTYRNLGNLDILKFVSIKYEEDPVYPDLLNMHIYLIPNLRMVVGADLELSSSNYESRTDLIGISGSVLFRNRNLLGGAEIFDTRLEGGIEFDRDNDRGIFSLNVGVQADLFFPKYLIPYRWWDKNEYLYDEEDLNIFEKFRKVMTERSQSRLSLGFNYLEYINSYSYYSFNFSLGHNLPVSNKRQISFNRIGIDYFVPLNQPPGEIPELIEQSFTKQLFTGFIFRDINYLSRTKVNERGMSRTFRGNLEVSGLEISLANFFWNEIQSNVDTFVFPGGKAGDIAFSKYIKLELENGWNKILNPRSSLAARASIGIAVPYASSNTVPFVKQYYVGGPYSLRAWSVRELGPGSYMNPNIDVENQPFFQTGDLKLELNLEYRFDLFWYLEGALFLDAGNIWTLSDASEDDRPGSQITSDFWREVAVGTGAGIRFDFSYFIVRLDTGFKVKSPFKTKNGNYWAYPNLGEMLKDPNYNIAIGYPF